jgi:hypothetical protein
MNVMVETIVTEMLCVQTQKDLLIVHVTLDILVMEDSVQVTTSFFKYWQLIPIEINSQEVAIR